jgi:glycosyltransferase involved in cell wall biosynthesis
LLALRADRIITISKSTADAVAEYEYIDRKKIEVIYNGIKDLNERAQNRKDLMKELELSPKYIYIGTISRLEPIKNQAMMINAFHKVKSEIPDAKLILIGDGAEMQKLKQQVKLLDIERDVIFTGFLDSPQRFINIFEIFLLSSFSEGTSMTLLEAMSLSKPCIVTDVGGNPEIVEDGRTGLLVPSNDVYEFSNAIIRLLNDDNTRLRYGEAGRARYLSKFTVFHMVSAYERCYQKNYKCSR